MSNVRCVEIRSYAIQQQAIKNRYNSAIVDYEVFRPLYPQDAPAYGQDKDSAGNMLLQWRNNNSMIIAEMILKGDGSLGYTYYQNGDYVAGSADSLVSEGLPEELYNYLMSQ